MNGLPLDPLPQFGPAGPDRLTGAVPQQFTSFSLGLRVLGLDLSLGRLLDHLLNKGGLGVNTARLPGSPRPLGELPLIRGRALLILHAASTAGLPGELRLRPLVAM